MRITRQVLPAALTLLGLLGIPTAVLGQTESKADKLVQGGNQPDAVLMYTGDVIGYLEPCG